MSDRNLPSHKLQTATGVISNAHPRALAGAALRSAKNADCFGKFQTIGKVPGSSRVSPTFAFGVKSLHQFEFSDLSGVRQYHQIALAGTLMSRIESPSSLTYLPPPTGASFTAAPLTAASYFDRLHMTGAEQRGFVTGGLKYDGANLRNWGVQAPGTLEVVQEAFTNTSGWGISADALLTTTTTSKDGGGALEVEKVGTSVADAHIFKAGLGLDLSAAGAGLAFMWVFLPAGTLQLLATSGAAVEVTLGDGGLGNADHHAFTVGELLPGWNLLSMGLASPDSVTGAGATLSAIDTLKAAVNYKNAATTHSGIIWDHFHTRVEGRPTATIGAAGLINAAVSYRVSFLTENGVESNGGPVSATVSPSSEQVDLTAIPVAADDQVIARRIYRDLDGDRVYRFVTQIDDNSTTTYTDNIADASLGAATLPIAGDTLLDSSPPERMSAVTAHKNRIFGIDADNPTIMHISDVNQPEMFRLVDQLQFDEALVAIESHGLGLMIYGHDKTYLLSGNGVTSAFRAEEVSPVHGANNFRAVTKAKTLHIAMREAEAFLVANPTDPWLINSPIYDQWRNGAFTDVFVHHDRSRFRVLFIGKSSGQDTYDTIWAYQYGVSGGEVISGEGAGVDPQDLRAGFWHQLELPSALGGVTTVASVESSDETLELWAGAEDSYVYRLNDPDEQDWADGASAAPVECELEWYAVPLGQAEGGRGEPRYLALQAECTVSSTWTITITLLSDVDGAVLDTTTTSVTFPAGKSSPIVALNPATQQGSWAQVKLSNANAGEDGRFERVELYYTPRGPFRGARTS